MNPQTLAQKIWQRHIVHEESGKPAIVYMDCHLVHEVSSPQAFDGLRQNGRKVRRPDLTFATADHNVPTWSRSVPINDPLAKAQVEALERNCREFGIQHFGPVHLRIVWADVAAHARNGRADRASLHACRYRRRARAVDAVVHDYDRAGVCGGGSR